MRKISLESCVAFLLFLLLSVTGSCDRLGDKTDSSNGELCVSFDDLKDQSTRSYQEIPDTSDFLLTICDSKANLIYDGMFGDCPESLDLPSGSYVVKALSASFTKPAFNAPQFGDEQCVVVPAGGRVGVKLSCSQMNAGVKLDISPDFLTEYPDAVLFLKSSSGKLMYSYSEKRTAYFSPGIVSLNMSDSKGETLLMTADLKARDMLTVRVSVATSGSEGASVSMSVDTLRTWLAAECLIGGGTGSGSHEVLTVAQAIGNIPAEDVWVSGYVVGGDLTPSGASFDLPFKSRTNIVLGPRSSTVERDACLSVQLPEGAVRDALNLVDNPDVHRRKVLIKGDVVESYYGMPGIKNVIDFQLF